MILHDFKCECGAGFESLVKSDQFKEECPECGEQADRVMSAPRVGLYNDPAVRSAALRQRSFNHSQKEAKANPEAIAKKTGGTPKAQSPWNARSRKKTT